MVGPELRCVSEVLGTALECCSESTAWANAWDDAVPLQGPMALQRRC